MSEAKPKLIDRTKWDQLTSEEQIREQIAVRTELQGMMVGGLYPGILEDEIWDLLDKINDLKN